MSQLLTVFIWWCSTSFVLSNYINDLKEKFNKIENETNLLEAINEQISERLTIAEEEFNRKLRQENKKEKSLDGKIQIEVKNLEDLQSSLTKMYFEEKKLEDELNLEKFHLNRNQLTITILEQDLALLNRRKQDQLNKECFELEKQVAPEILLRSSSGNDIDLIVLQSMFKRKLTSLNNAKSLTNQLQDELTYKQNMYNTMLTDIQVKIENSAGDFKLIIKNVSELQERLNKVSQNVDLMKFQLLGLLKENKALGEKIKQLKLNLQEFNEDSACYQKIVSEDFLHIH